MGMLLITTVYGKEDKARLEVLDCIFPHDPAASCSPQPYGGLLLLETGMGTDEAARKLVNCPTTLVIRVIPIDYILDTDLEKICSAVLSLVPRGTGGVAVDCVRRGREIGSSHEVEEEVGRRLRGRGDTIDLDNPSLVVRIDIIGGRTTISVRPPSGFVTKSEGPADV